MELHSGNSTEYPTNDTQREDVTLIAETDVTFQSDNVTDEGTGVVCFLFKQMKKDLRIKLCKNTAFVFEL